MAGGGQDQWEVEGGGRIPVMDPLTKTSPISGAVGARGIGRRLAAVCGFGSLLSVREEERSLSEACRHTWASHDGAQSKREKGRGALSLNTWPNKRPILPSNCLCVRVRSSGGGVTARPLWHVFTSCSQPGEKPPSGSFWGWRETKPGSQDAAEIATCCYLSQAG